MSSLTLVHIFAGSAAVLLGFVALLTRKGAPTHVIAGRLFVGTMAISSLMGSVLGILNVEAFFITIFAGLLGAYFVLSGWLSASNSDGRFGWPTAFLAVLNIANVVGLIWVGNQALEAGGILFSFAAEDYFFLAAMGGVGVLGDASLLFRTSLSDRLRIARHLWRMCLGFFIAAGSAFTGPGATAFPDPIRNSGALALPELFIFLALVFFLVRTIFRRSAPR